jgi:hypothetical protein
MKLQFLSKMKYCVPVILFAFVFCVAVGLFCPMPASATDTSHSQSASHHSSSSQTTGECPEQQTSSAGMFEKNDASVGVVSAAAVTWLNDIPSFDLFKFLGNERAPRSTTYPLLFLLFSVFLN